MNKNLTLYNTVHATALIIKESGILIRGKSGSGKSSLALNLINEAKNIGLFSRLVSDDRVRLFATHDALIALPHPVIEGKIELRGIGVMPIDYEKSCVLRVVIDIDDNPPRMPEFANETVEISGIKLLWIKIKMNEISTSAVMHFLKKH